MEVKTVSINPAYEDLAVEIAERISRHMHRAIVRETKSRMRRLANTEYAGAMCAGVLHGALSVAAMEASISITKHEEVRSVDPLADTIARAERIKERLVERLIVTVDEEALRAGITGLRLKEVVYGPRPTDAGGPCQSG